ncbi:ATPase assembly factor ATP10 [Phlebopus sp. FC_14]|nr:ATPase assembly factor ATP10 [Phlebopus sp. FC_14]
MSVRPLLRYSVTLDRLFRQQGCSAFRLSSSLRGDEPAREKSAAHAPLPLLQRPLGVKERPLAHTKTWEETRKELMDQEVRLQQRNHLIKEATKGYFTDLNATRRHGGKTWIAPNVMIREDKALYFPNISGSRLDTRQKTHTADICQGRISVISMLSTRMSEVHVKGFVSPTNARYLSNPLYQHVQINLQENLLKSWLVSLFLSSIAKEVPAQLHPTYLVSNQDMEYVREPLGIVNKHVGYVYLVDEQLKVRWAGCADAKVEEAKALEQCTGVLLNRLDKKKKSST